MIVYEGQLLKPRNIVSAIYKKNVRAFRCELDFQSEHLYIYSKYIKRQKTFKPQNMYTFESEIYVTHILLSLCFYIPVTQNTIRYSIFHELIWQKYEQRALKSNNQHGIIHRLFSNISILVTSNEPHHPISKIRSSASLRLFMNINMHSNIRKHIGFFSLSVVAQSISCLLVACVDTRMRYFYQIRLHIRKKRTTVTFIYLYKQKKIYTNSNVFFDRKQSPGLKSFRSHYETA